MTVPRTIRLAHAKVNPFLRVLGRRDDGYHDIETLIVPIGLADEIEIVEADDLRLVIDGDHAGHVPVGEENLAVRAARMLALACGQHEAVEIRLTKRIPVAAGLGGGSADAAAALTMLAERWACPSEMVQEVAVRLGSDVPALLLGGWTIARGRGERLEPVPPQAGTWIVAPADFGISAADAYRWWDEDGGTTGPDPAPFLDALRAGDFEAAGLLMHNDLEPGILRRYPDLEETRARLLADGALGAVVTGSGPTVVALAHPSELAPDDSNVHFRIQSPASYPLDEGPSVRARRSPAARRA